MTWFIIFSCLSAITSGNNLIYNGDFELPSLENPPSGWAMWGADKYKIPDNYTRDTVNPHSGKACFRIHHPSGTAGYIVSAPALSANILDRIVNPDVRIILLQIKPQKNRWNC